jgi:hypothetical protein
MREAFEIGGIVAAVVLVAFGIAAIAMGATVRAPSITTWQNRRSPAPPT